jgi:hypothetical protein
LGSCWPPARRFAIVATGVDAVYALFRHVKVVVDVTGVVVWVTVYKIGLSNGYTGIYIKLLNSVAVLVVVTSVAVVDVSVVVSVTVIPVTVTGTVV